MLGRSLDISERVYRALLAAYPKEFRDAFGPQMAQAFRDECREAVGRAGMVGLIALWSRTVFDLLFTALAERRKASAATSRIERLRHATVWIFRDWRWRKFSRSGIWMLVMLWAVWLGVNVVLSTSDQRQGNLWINFPLQIMLSGLICLATGELLYTKRKTLAGLLWLAGLFVFLPLAVASMAMEFLSRGTAFGTALVMLYLGWLLITYGVFAWRYLFSTGSGDARRG